VELPCTPDQFFEICRVQLDDSATWIVMRAQSDECHRNQEERGWDEDAHRYPSAAGETALDTLSDSESTSMRNVTISAAMSGPIAPTRCRTRVEGGSLHHPLLASTAGHQTNHDRAYASAKNARIGGVVALLIMQIHGEHAECHTPEVVRHGMRLDLSQEISHLWEQTRSERFGHTLATYRSALASLA
jgi:hypothetical protein